ncbi:hypothetical protein HQ535_06410 [bacterium]|nr:hypothetical protein [bacterium]
MKAPETIICMECDNEANLVSYPPPDDEFRPGDFVVYLCPNCGQRIDLVLDDTDE